MRSILLVMLGLLYLTAPAQSLTESQRQEALQCATKFCDLLTRFSNGDRTLNSQINALCSGADCSAFDDIKTNKELTLRNYLLAIQTKFPDKLPTTVSVPTLADSKTYFEPVVSLGSEFGSVTGNEYGTAEMAILSVENIKNAYIVFNVVQKYPTLGKSVDKKLVYDVKSKKITAFIINDGAFISFLNGLTALANKNYQTALSFFELAAQNDRSSLKNSCYGLAAVCCCYALNFEKAIHYADLSGNTLLAEVLELTNCLQKEQVGSLYPHVTKLESLVGTNSDLTDREKGNVYTMLGNVYASPMYPYQDMKKGAFYFEKAGSLGVSSADFALFLYYTLLGDDFVSAEVAFSSLKRAAQRGYPPACYPYGVIKEETGDVEEAQRLFETSAKSGNYIAMACLGKLLIEKGDKTNGVKWLRKSLTCGNLDERIELEGFGSWPTSRTDVQTLLNRYEYSSGSHFPPSYSGSSYSSSSSSESSSSNSSYSSSGSSYSSSGNSHNYSSYSSYRSHHKFNEAKDDYCMGLSAGYVRKEWMCDFGDTKEKLDVFWEDEYTNGLQVGLRVDCQFGYGFGMNSGLFYEYYFDKSTSLFEDGFEYYFRMKEHSLYLPVHFKYNLNFSKWFQIGLYGGIGLDFGLSGKYMLYSYGEELDSFSMYDDEYDLKRFNASLEYGVSVRMRRLQFNFTIARGLVNMSGHEEYTVKQNKPMSLSVSLCF